jgi:hypothetical protein
MTNDPFLKGFWPLDDKALAFCHFSQRPVDSSKAFQHKYIWWKENKERSLKQ